MDADGNESIPFVNISATLKKSNKELVLAQTDFDGKFNFEFNLNKFNDSLLIKFVGYNSCKSTYLELIDTIKMTLDTSLLLRGEVIFGHYDCWGGKGYLYDSIISNSVYITGKVVLEGTQIPLSDVLVHAYFIEGGKNTTYYSTKYDTTNTQGRFVLLTDKKTLKNGLSLNLNYFESVKNRYLSIDNYENLIVEYSNISTPQKIDPHQMSTGTIYRDGEFESIK